MRTFKNGVRIHEFDGVTYDHFRMTGSGRKVHLFSRTFVDDIDSKTKAVKKGAADIRDAQIAELVKAGAQEQKEKAK